MSYVRCRKCHWSGDQKQTTRVFTLVRLVCYACPVCTETKQLETVAKKPPRFLKPGFHFRRVVSLTSGIYTTKGLAYRLARFL